MSGLFLGRGSACGWCDESSSSSESSSESLSESLSVSDSGSDSSSSGIRLGTTCARCVGQVTPYQYKVSIVSTVTCPTQYTKTYYLRRADGTESFLFPGGNCAWFTPDYVLRSTSACSERPPFRRAGFFMSQTGVDVVVSFVIVYEGFTYFRADYRQVFASTNGQINCLQSFVLPVDLSLAGFPSSVTVTPA